jgi:hypothetical protein
MEFKLGVLVEFPSCRKEPISLLGGKRQLATSGDEMGGELGCGQALPGSSLCGGRQWRVDKFAATAAERVTALPERL